MADPIHIHIIPVDPSLSPAEAWREICLMHVRTTFTCDVGEESWAVIDSCDGSECEGIAWDKEGVLDG